MSRIAVSSRRREQQGKPLKQQQTRRVARRTTNSDISDQKSSSTNSSGVAQVVAPKPPVTVTTITKATAVAADVNNDYESPGFEFLRSYHCMDMLYLKLLTLNYRKEFCANYKCPNIHRYYFSIPNKRQSEQQFLFTCLCAWLIKEKCQMNLDLEPQEYEDLDYTIEMILEALKLLISPENGPKVSIGFPPARLKQGYGPEVIWTMNILADRALELKVTNEPNLGRVEISFHNKSTMSDSRDRLNSITIGQPVVGGGLTTRPLGSYQVDDATLAFDTGEDPSSFDEQIDSNKPADTKDDLDPDCWYAQVEKASSYLNTVNLTDEEAVATKSTYEDWIVYLNTIKQFDKDISGFISHSKPLLESVTNRIDRQLQVINGREKFMQTNLEPQLQEFLQIYRNFNDCERQNNDLTILVNSKADKFEGYKLEIRHVNETTQFQVRELNDGSKLRELEQAIETLDRENHELNIKIGLMLTVHAKIHQDFIERQKCRA